MEKSDEQIHRICLRAINRSLMKTAQLTCTQLYEVVQNHLPLSITPQENEYPICSTIIDKDNWSLLTTQRLITKHNSKVFKADIEHATDLSYGDIKGYSKQPFTTGKVLSNNLEEIPYLIETGQSSMVMVYGVRTRIQIQNKVH